MDHFEQNASEGIRQNYKRIDGAEQKSSERMDRLHQTLDQRLNQLEKRYTGANPFVFFIRYAPV